MSPTVRHLVTLATALLVGAVVGLAVHTSITDKRQRAIAETLSELLQNRLDSLEQRQSRQADSIAIETSKRLAELRRSQAALADTLREVRKGIVPPDTTVRDSLRYWHAVADTAIAETVVLRAALAVADSQVASLTITGARVLAERDSSWSRVSALTDGIDRLRVELKAAAPCRIIWKLPCPSRGVTLALGVAGGAGIVALSQRRKE